MASTLKVDNLQNSDGTRTIASDSGTAWSWGAGVPQGTILQVKNSYVNAASNVFNVSSEPSGTSGGQNFVAPSTPLSVNITPKVSGNKFLLMCNFTYSLASDLTAMFVIKRTAPTVAYSSGVADTSGEARTASFVGVNGNNSGYKMGASITWLDTSVSEAEHTYSLFGGHNGTGSVVYLGGTHANYVGGSTLTVMEVQG